MIKAKLVIATLCMLAAFNVYADSSSDNTTQQPAKQEQSGNNEEKSQSLYDSIKSGWNSMLDAMVGPAKPDNSKKNQ